MSDQSQPAPRSLVREIGRALIEFMALGLFVAVIAIWWIITP